MKTTEAEKRETILADAYNKAIEYINKDFEDDSVNIRLLNYDMKNFLKK